MDKFLQTIAYGNIFIAEVEIKKSKIKALTIPFVWKRYIDVISSLSHTNRHVVNQFIEQANKFYPIIKITAEISVLEATFLNTIIYKGERFNKEKKKTSSKKTRYDSSRLIHLKEKLKGNMRHTWLRDYLENFVDNPLSEVKFVKRKRALFHRKKNESCPLQQNNTVQQIETSKNSLWVNGI